MQFASDAHEMRLIASCCARMRRAGAGPSPPLHGRNGQDLHGIRLGLRLGGRVSVRQVTPACEIAGPTRPFHPLGSVATQRAGPRNLHVARRGPWPDRAGRRDAKLLLSMASRLDRRALHLDGGRTASHRPKIKSAWEESNHAGRLRRYRRGSRDSGMHACQPMAGTPGQS